MSNLLSKFFQKRTSKSHSNKDLQLEIENTQRQFDSHDNYAKGINFENQQKYEDAIACYNIAIELDYFNNAFIYACRGHCFQLLDNDELAIEDFNKAISIKPDILYDVYYFRAKSNEKLSRFNDYASDLKKVISIFEHTNERTEDESRFYYDVKLELVQLEYNLELIAMLDKQHDIVNELIEKVKKD